MGGPSNDDGYVAVGAAGEAPAKPVAPTGDVELVPLDGADRSGEKDRAAGEDGPDDRTGSGPVGRTPSKSPDESGSSGPSGGTQSTGPSGGTRSSGPPESPAVPEPSAPAEPRPAVLKVSEPVREAAEERWCEQVTLEFRNTGGTPVRSGTVTFGSHVIGPLGTDWSTVESEEPLPVPIGAGDSGKETWTVCVDSWRVPLGMHVETRDVSVKWK